MIRKQTKLWTTASGNKIRICDMDDSHLINTVKFLERNGDKDRQVALNAALRMSCMLSGEMASECIESNIEMLMDEDGGELFFPPIYENLILELMRRDL